MTAQHPIHQMGDCWVRLVQIHRHHRYHHHLHFQEEKRVGTVSLVINQHVAGYQVVMMHCEVNEHASWHCHLLHLFICYSENHVTFKILQIYSMYTACSE
jgi:hypothetical protein